MNLLNLTMSGVRGAIGGGADINSIKNALKTLYLNLSILSPLSSLLLPSSSSPFSLLHRNIDQSKFLAFGILYKLIRRFKCYPRVVENLLNTDKGNHDKKENNKNHNHKLASLVRSRLDGSRDSRQIAHEFGKSYKKIKKVAEGGGRWVVLEEFR